MSPRSLAVVVAVALLLAGALPATALGGAASGAAQHPEGVSATDLTPHNTTLDPGDVEFRAELGADGDARWRVMTVVSVTDGDERAAFEELVARFNETNSPLGVDTFRASAANVSQATGREMAIRNVERHHELHNETGALWVTFTWTNFGRTTGDRLSVDDGFNTTTGVWLPSLSPEETLVVAPPPGYGVSSAPTGSSAAPTSLTNGVARWEGPQDFGERGPWIVYSGDAQTPPPTAPGPTGTVSATGTPGGPTTSATGPPGDGDGPFAGAVPLLVVVVLVVVVAVGFVAYTRGDDDGLGGLVGGTGDESGGATAEHATEESADIGETAANGDGGATAGASDAESSSAGTAGASAGARAADDEATADDADESGDDGIDEALLSDEERVERLIEQNGGRMKQAAIVQETGWSNAKVSQLLSAMDEEGRIDKLRIGRENLISFPDEDVADLDSE